MAMRTSTLGSRNSKMLPPPAISYRLSDDFFLDLGWTAVPTAPPMETIVVMKAMLSSPTLSNYIKVRPSLLKKQYPNGKKVLVAYPDGSGRIYYPSGRLAVKIDKGGVDNHRTRVWVFSSGEEDDIHGGKPSQLCALFDSLGNGVVYDVFMNKRLVYNQDEGVLWDSPSGVPVFWKWHDLPKRSSLTSLNEDDEKYKILEKPFKRISETSKRLSEDRKGDAQKKENWGPQRSLLTAEKDFDQARIEFLKKMEFRRYLNTAKLPKKVSPLKPIVLTINRYLVLRIFSQSEIFLNFFTKTHRHKLRIGILYNPFDEVRVAHTEKSFKSDRVMCTFEALPAATRSMLNYKELVQSIRINSTNRQSSSTGPMDRVFGNAVRRSISLAHLRTPQKTVSASEIRKSFVDFFCRSNDHLHIRSGPVFSLKDPTLAFTNAGMNQFKDVFLGLIEPASSRVANSQKCIRIGGTHNDLSQVGQDGSHHTFFEMLGNWSFGDYFKEEACRMSWELLTEVFNIPPERLYVTYFGGDQALGLKADVEILEIWRKIGVKESHILAFGAKENFWAGGPTGPCGPCTEIHYDHREGRTDASHLVNSGSHEVTELWNLVFTQFDRKATGELKKLKKHFVDTGMGLERLVAVLQGKTSNYDTDLFLPLFEVIKKHTGHSGYGGKYDGNAIDCSYRILADHSRMIAVALSDGMIPNHQSKVRGVFRKALTVSEKIFRAKGDLLKELSNHVAEILSDAYPEIGKNLSKIHYIIDTEVEILENHKRNVLSQWSRIKNSFPALGDMNVMENPQMVQGMEYLKKNVLNLKEKVLTPEDIFVLFDTYGVPVHVTEQIALKLGLAYDMAAFLDYERNVKATNKEQTHSKYMAERNESSYLEVLNLLEEKKIPGTLDYFKHDYRVGAEGKYIFQDQETTIEAILLGDELVDEIRLQDVKDNQEIGLILDRTHLFSEEGGQAGDQGTLEIEKKIFFDVTKAIKVRDFVIHFGQFRESFSDAKVSVEDIGVLQLDKTRRLKIMRNHTGLHLVNAFLRRELGVSGEKTSAATPEKLNMSFMFYKANVDSAEGVQRLEKFVNEFILNGVSVKRIFYNHPLYLGLDDVVFFPGEPLVKGEIPVIEINDGFKLSKEYCTGTHLLNTSDLEGFVVTKFLRGASDRIIKVEAVTGEICEKIKKVEKELERKLRFLEEKIPSDEMLLEVNYKELSDVESQLIQMMEEINSTGDISHLVRLTLTEKINAEKKRISSVMKSNIRETLRREVENASAKTQDPFVVVCVNRSWNFKPEDLEIAVENFEDKPVLALLRREGSVAVQCIVPKKFVSNKFSAKEWLVESAISLGGIAKCSKNQDPKVFFHLSETKASKDQVEVILLDAVKFAKQNL